jgi:signal transduction histidine kinase
VIDWLRHADLPGLLRTITARIAAVQAAITAVFVIIVVAFVYNETVGAFERDNQRTLESELGQIRKVFQDGGLRAANQDMIVRSSAPGPLLYVLTNAAGEVMVGDFSTLPRADVSEATEPVEFFAEVEVRPGGFDVVRVRGVISRLALAGPIVMIGRDMSAQDAAAARIVRLLFFVLGAGLLVALGAGLMAGREAARRAAQLSTTTREVMAGDLSRRAPITARDDEFNRLALDLNAMLDRLQTLVVHTRSAGDAIAHDLRSPLTRMRARVEAALSGPADGAQDRDALSTTLEECDRLLQTFNAVMQIARMETRNTWAFERVDLSAVAGEFAEFYEPVAEDEGRRLIVTAPAGVFVQGDARLLGQAISNLIENALKYIPEGGRAWVSTVRRQDGFVELRVEDDGPGIPSDMRARVVDRFARLETHRTSPGVGLGLSLVKSIAEVHGGRLELRDGVASAAGPGLCAALVLPAWSAR